MRILLVDDNSDLIKITAKLLAAKLALRGIAGDVRWIDHAARAVDFARDFEPDGILLDLGMPEIDGYTLATRLRQVPRLEHCRIVAVSGHPPDHERLARAGIDGHLLKPAGAEAMIDAVRQTACAGS